MKWVGYVARIGEMTYGYNVVLGEAEGKRPLATPKCRWKDNIKINLLDLQGGVFLKFDIKL
jgi:hypothetical protein